MQKGVQRLTTSSSNAKSKILQKQGTETIEVYRTFKGDGWGFKARKEGAAEGIGVRGLSN
jgi:hypothetical protein